MGRPRKSDAPWTALLKPDEQAELDALDVEAAGLRRRLAAITYRRVQVTARARTRLIDAQQKEDKIELKRLRKQLAEGRKLAF
jgi:hypothetical protein